MADALAFLETVSDEDLEVQFVHQTAKQLMLSGSGFTALYGDTNNIPLENGHTFLLRYYVSATTENNVHPPFRDLFYHAHKAESISGTPSLDSIERWLLARQDNLRNADFEKILSTMKVDG